MVVLPLVLVVIPLAEILAGATPVTPIVVAAARIASDQEQPKQQLRYEVKEVKLKEYHSCVHVKSSCGPSWSKIQQRVR